MASDERTSPDDWRERRRLHAWTLHRQGWSQTRIARELGVTQGAVSQWIKRAQAEGGEAALYHRPTSGRRATLGEEQLTQLPDLLAQGARVFGFENNRWTTARVAALLKQRYGVSYHPAHVSRLLRKYCPDWRSRRTPSRP